MALTEAQKQEVERLRSEHPDYAAKKSEWMFFLQAYEGGKDYVSEKTLFKHQREHPEDYKDRLERAYYTNYCQPLVDFVPEFIYSQGVNRHPPAELQQTFDNFRKNVDRSGSELDAFMESVAEEARIFGHTFVVVDLPQKPADLADKILSVAEAEDLGLDVPYFYHVRPLEILDWVNDQFGNFLYVKRKEVFYEKGPSRRGFRKVERYTEWQKDSITISKIDVSDDRNEKLLPKEKMDNQWNLIPYVQFYFKRSKTNKDFGLSFLNDLAYQNRAVFNQTSYLEEFLARQCFNMLAMEASTSVPTRDRSDGRVGTSNVLFVPREAKFEPQYISPPVEPAVFIQDERANTIKEMYRVAAQDILAEVFGTGGSAPSADAQKQAFARTIPMIAKQAEMMQSAEQSLWAIWCQLQKKKWDGVISYRDDYGITNLQDLLLQLSTIFNNLKVLPPSFIRAEWKRIIREFDGKLSSEDQKKAFDEIDKISDDELVMGYKMADVKATNGVPSTANMIQGKEQKTLGTDGKIAARQKSRAATKEANPDANRRATQAQRAERAKRRAAR
jgi:hypothetical protein